MFVQAQQDQTRQRFKELSDGLNLLEGSFNEDKLETEQKLNKEAQERENLEKVGTWTISRYTRL